MADWVTGKVTKIKFWTDALFSLTVRPHPSVYGRTVAKLGLDIDGERVQRAYRTSTRPIIRISSSIWLPSDGKLSPRGGA